MVDANCVDIRRWIHENATKSSVIDVYIFIDIDVAFSAFACEYAGFGRNVSSISFCEVRFWSSHILRWAHSSSAIQIRSHAVETARFCSLDAF